jgi:hypothetical protein
MPDVITEAADTLNSLAASAVAEVTETMAFLCAEPIAPGVPALPPPEPCVCLTMVFSGPVSGDVQVIAPKCLGGMITANVLCSDADHNDALMEFLNMTCGVLFRSAADRFKARFEIGLPKLENFDVHEGWQEFISRAGASVMDIEGVTIAVAVSVSGGK